MPGVAASNSGGTRNERLIFVRGFDRFQVPLSIDGIRVYLPADNRIDFNRFLTPDLGEVQIRKAFVSVLDGPGAMGGAINLVTSKPTSGSPIPYMGYTDNPERPILHFWFGPLTMIAAPDVVARTVDPGDFLQFASGRIGATFVNTQEDLDQRLATLDRAPDPDGRYRVNEFCCRDSSWQATVVQLIERADAVVMDLRGFNAQRAAENIGAGYHTLAEAFSGWRDSPSHNKNMLLTGATKMGIAAAYAPNSKYKVFWALVLAEPDK